LEEFLGKHMAIYPRQRKGRRLMLGRNVKFLGTVYKDIPLITTTAIPKAPSRTTSLFVVPAPDFAVVDVGVVTAVARAVPVALVIVPDEETTRVAGAEVDESLEVSDVVGEESNAVVDGDPSTLVLATGPVVLEDPPTKFPIVVAWPFAKVTMPFLKFPLLPSSSWKSPKGRRMSNQFQSQ
jgi:hypothetical protein